MADVTAALRALSKGATAVGHATAGLLGLGLVCAPPSHRNPGGGGLLAATGTDAPLRNDVRMEVCVFERA